MGTQKHYPPPFLTGGGGRGGGLVIYGYATWNFQESDRKRISLPFLNWTIIHRHFLSHFIVEQYIWYPYIREHFRFFDLVSNSSRPFEIHRLSSKVSKDIPYFWFAFYYEVTRIKLHATSHHAFKRINLGSRESCQESALDSCHRFKAHT